MELPDPMLASGGEVPTGGGWCFEPKWDGIRVIASAGGEGRMRSRPGSDLTARFPEVAAALERLPADAVVDGELVVLGEDGRPDLEQLRRRLARGDGARRWAGHPATLIVFDGLAYRDSQTLSSPWLERRGLLDRLPLDGERVVRCLWYEDGSALWEAVVAQRLEGVVAKRCAAPYRPGRRTRDRVKTKHTADSDHVVVGVDEHSQTARLPGCPPAGRWIPGLRRPRGPRRPAGRRHLPLSLKPIAASPIGCARAGFDGSPPTPTSPYAPSRQGRGCARERSSRLRAELESVHRMVPPEVASTGEQPRGRAARLR